MYGSCATARDFEIYAPNATFEDPLMRAHGVKQIKSSFYSLPKVFGESKITEYTVQETPTGPGKAEVVIENKQHYKMLGRAVELASRIRLQVEDGKVVRHEDWWDGKPLKQAHRRVPAPGEDGGGRAPGRHDDHPRAHGLRKGPTNDPIVLFICQQIIYCMYIMRVQWSSTLLH